MLLNLRSARRRLRPAWLVPLVAVALLGAAADDPPVRAAATLTVDVTTDGPDDTPGNGRCYNAVLERCSLRAAIMEANALPGDDTIVLPAGVYELTVLGQFEDNAATGDLDITSNIILNGDGRDSTFVDGNAADTVFDARSGATAQLNGLTIRNGSGGGFPGGIGNRGNLTIADSRIVDNRAGSGGGGIVNAAGATLSLQNTEVIRNSAGSNGGGIFNRGSLSMLRSDVAGNTARDGGGIFNNAGTVSLFRTSVNDNSAGNEGGGIWNDATLALTQSFVVGNRATGGTSYGGGIFNRGTATIGSSRLAGNRTERGGGNIYTNGSLELTGSEVSGGQAGTGGGISNGAQATLVNVTLSGNAALGVGGGWYNNVAGSQAVSLSNVTVANNTAAVEGGAIYNYAGAVTLRNAIVANSGAGAYCLGALNSAGNNLDSGNGCGFGAGGDRANADPRLAPLADNGSSQPGQTHALLAGSPAIDAAGGSACPGTDQRLRPRPQDGNGDGGAACDIGAYEADAPAASPSPSPAPSAPPAPRTTFLPYVVNGRPWG